MNKKLKRKSGKRKSLKREKVQPRKGSLAEFFAASPLRESGIDLKRLDCKLREIDW
jgi:hypothetical protein